MRSAPTSSVNNPKANGDADRALPSAQRLERGPLDSRNAAPLASSQGGHRFAATNATRLSGGRRLDAEVRAADGSGRLRVLASTSVWRGRDAGWGRAMQAVPESWHPLAGLASPDKVSVVAKANGVPRDPPAEAPGAVIFREAVRAERAPCEPDPASVCGRPGGGDCVIAVKSTEVESKLVVGRELHPLDLNRRESKDRRDPMYVAGRELDAEAARPPAPTVAQPEVCAEFRKVRPVLCGTPCQIGRP